MGGTGNISPFPNILLTPADASPLNAPVASGATAFGAVLATVGRTVLAKKDASAPRNPPFFTLSRYLLCTNVYINSCFICCISSIYLRFC